MSDGSKIIDMVARRQAQLEDSPVLKLADDLVQLVSDRAIGMDPEDLLVAIELTARALLKTLQRSQGDMAMNQIIVEAQHRMRRYEIIPSNGDKDDGGEP